MTVNPNQISVAKIYPGNYTNVLRYWHEEKSVVYLNENGTSQTLTSQPIGGPVGVIFQPGWIAQQAIGYVDLSYQALGSVNQLEYYAQPYGSGLNGSNGSFSSANVIIPSPDYHKDVRADIADGITVPSGAYVYRASLRVDGGDVVSSGVGGGVTSPCLTLVPAMNQGLRADGTVVSGQFGVTVSGLNSRITNGTNNSVNIFNSSNLSALTADRTWQLFATRNLGGVVASGLTLASGVYDPRAQAGKLSGKNKALAICEVCWMVPDEAPKRDDLVLQPAGLVESSTYTSTVPS
jgi:hypothetical protein